jgi:hypothetical protein
MVATMDLVIITMMSCTACEDFTHRWKSLLMLVQVL